MLYIREYPTQERLKQLFDYIDGHLVWNDRPISDFTRPCAHGAFKVKCVGKIARAGKISGYWVTKINGSAYRTHRLIWIWNFGDLSTSQEIDHEDGDKLNYAITNLRLANRGQNVLNRGAQCNSKTGIKGVSWSKDKNKWIAQIKISDKTVRRRFNTIEEAEEFVRRTREMIHGEFHNHG